MVKHIPPNKKENKNKYSSNIESRLADKPENAPIHAGAFSQDLPAAAGLRGDKKTNEKIVLDKKTKTNPSISDGLHGGKGDKTSFQELVSSIKSKKELSSLDDDFVKQKIEKIFSANNTIKKKFESSASFSKFSRSREYETLLKTLRKELRAIYGVFQAENTNRNDLLKELRLAKNTDEKHIIIKKILESHTSTKERLPYYDEIYSQICSKIKPKSVIDLGCGMNPIAYSHFVEHGCKPTIIASDVSRDDMAYLEEAFRLTNIPGKTIALDLTKDSDIARLRELKGDVTLLLKLLDSLEEARRHISYTIFDALQTPWIIASFPTKSLGGKKNIARIGRAWFERLLLRKNMEWTMFSVENELFYVIKRK